MLYHCSLMPQCPRLCTMLPGRHSEKLMINLKMRHDTIIGLRRGNMFFNFSFALIICAVLLTILVYSKILPTRKINYLFDVWGLTFLSIIFGIPYLIAILKYLDKRPMIIIDSFGVSMRKSLFPLAGLKQIDWNDIKDYDAEVKRLRFMDTMYLTITCKSTNKKYYADLFDLNIEPKKVLDALYEKLSQPKQID